MKKKKRPYIRSATVISKPHHRPKARVICVTSHGRRQTTRPLTHTDDLHWLSRAFLNTFRPE